ncbi:MAG: (E)-4-hydroxy-3-methylbut-2-enyl-diphosphate synthase [Chlamydiota bacterium]
MKKYCEATYQTKRWPTREVKVGNIAIGANNPVRIQSMTNTLTSDVEATVEQIERLSDKGCELVRVTVQSLKDAEACEHIKNTLSRDGYDIPLAVDIHFMPAAALRAVDFADKVRINPGNYADPRARFREVEYSDFNYAEDKFTPLVIKCRDLDKAMRIGVNHGSLSDRIMSKYGNTPEGMVASAVEFAEICRKNDYHNLIFSMKSSNPLVMIQAYRLLVAEQIEREWNYPLHLGVTEAGEGEDGIIKSSMGIGALLLDGLGDTIRVSLTGDPCQEIAPCKSLISFAASYQGAGIENFEESHRDIVTLTHRPVQFPAGQALHCQGSVLAAVDGQKLQQPDIENKIGVGTAIAFDGVVVEGALDDNLSQEKLIRLRKLGIATIELGTDSSENNGLRIGQGLVELDDNQEKNFKALTVGDDGWTAVADIAPDVILFSPQHNRFHLTRKFFEYLQNHQIDIPVVLAFDYHCSFEELKVRAAAELGALLIDGLGEGVMISASYELSALRSIGFNILQAARMRATKTEYISCPSCGRTQFDIQAVTRNIREKTGHLQGVKIAVMGCIVNGPGEMADADFGFIGSQPNKVDLYIGQQRVERGIDFVEATDKLIELIKKEGRWIEPK